MKKRLLSIWKDPVVSGLIVLSIGGIFSYFNWENTKKFFVDSYTWFIKLNIPFYCVIIFTIAIWLLSKLKIRKVKSKEELFRRNDYRFVFSDLNILCRYGVGIGFDGRPFIHNLKIYCNHHTPAHELIGGHCPILGCKNHTLGVTKYYIEQYLNDDIIHKWEQYDLENKK